MAIFHAPNVKNEALLPEDESLHAVKVLRLNAGSQITIFDGVGGVYEARITHPHPRRCGVEIISCKEVSVPSVRIHIAIAPTKSIERIEWFVEKATEIGIHTITPLLCHHSERKQIKTDRLNKIVVSACKQSKKPHFPSVNELTPIDQIIANAQESQRFIAHCHEQDKKQLFTEIKPNADILILIGPEGDFSEDEVRATVNAGFVQVSLGTSRLRTETAGLVACHIASLANV
jgi:16S rRNA (uracil1498-N3)-methyltransferase